jgi:RHS repeat-associated protein
MDASAYSGMSRVDYVHDGMLARSHGYNSGTGGWATHNHYHADGSGNITYMVSSSQTLAASYKYDPFGRTISSSGSLASANSYRFSSKEIRRNSGMYYYGYRWYDPNLQRWVNRDPLFEKGFRTFRKTKYHNAQDSNLYTFLNNQPISRTDPLGLQIWVCSRKTDWGFGNHTYFWDDTGKNPPCGKRGSSSSANPPTEDKDIGPDGGDACTPIDGSDGKEDDVMACCHKKANSGIWIPEINDCHNLVDRCLKRNGLKPPKNPRFGDPNPQPRN